VTNRTKFVMKLMGGLGNQMFQISAALTLSETMCRNVTLDTTWYKNRVDQNSHDSIPHVLRFPFLNCIATFEEDYWKYFVRKVGREIWNISGKRRFVETEIEYPSDFSLPVDFDFYEGYFQSLHFIPRRIAIDDVFNFSQFDFPLSNIETTNKIGVHIRLGDYLNSKIHKVSEITYLEKGLEILSSYTKFDDIIIFTDSPSLVTKFIPRSISKICSIAEKISDPILQLSQMASCKYFVGSASSFSWWAAYLNPNKITKTIVMPANVFNDYSLKHLSSRYPKEWNVI